MICSVLKLAAFIMGK